MKLAIVQIRGAMLMNQRFLNTLQSLKLIRKNSCVVVDDSKVSVGMIAALKDYVTWGEIDEETFTLLLEKRGRLAANTPLTAQFLKDKTKLDFNGFAKSFMTGKSKISDVPSMKPFFRLKPPTGGLDKGGIKKQYSLGGALGYRGKAINDLIRRML
jgi:large subunit ribosomal protein L30